MGGVFSILRMGNIAMQGVKSLFSATMGVLQVEKINLMITLALCCIAALNAWDGVEESGKRTESFT